MVKAFDTNYINASLVAPPTFGASFSNLFKAWLDSAIDINIEIGGLIPETQHDRIVVVGAATLAGNLNVSLIGGFVPAIGNSFVVLDAVTSSGSFTTNLPTLPTDRKWEVVYDDAQGTVTLNVVSAVLPIELWAFQRET